MSCGYNNVCVRVLWWYWRQACSQQGYTFHSKGVVVEAKKFICDLVGIDAKMYANEN